MSFWDVSEGKKLTPETATATAELGGGNSAPIPDGTHCRTMITDAKWDTHEGERFIKLRHDVIDGQFKKRVVFQKVKVNEPDKKKRDKHLRMFAAIDHNCGGALMKNEGEPSDMDLASNLLHKPMVIRVGVWDMGDKSGNWVQAVMPATAATPEVEVPVTAPKSAAPKAAQSSDIDDDLLF